MQLPAELCRYLVTWVAEPLVLGSVSRQWRALLGQAWYAEQHYLRQWRQLRGSLAQLPHAQALPEMLRWSPPQLTETIDQFAGALESLYTRWVLVTYWSTDVWGEAGLPQSVCSVLDKFTPGDTKLALAAHMGPTENVVSWWLYTCLWREQAATFDAQQLVPLSTACAQALTSEQTAFAWCAKRSLFANTNL